MIFEAGFSCMGYKIEEKDRIAKAKSGEREKKQNKLQKKERRENTD